MPLVDQDEEHLKILSVGYYVMAGMIVFFALFGLIYVVLGIVFTIDPPPTRSGDPPVTFMGPLFAIIGGLVTAFGSAFGVCTFLAGRYLKRRQHRTFCFVMAGLNCFYIPIGTALGVFTILVLLKSIDPSLSISQSRVRGGLIPQARFLGGGNEP